MVVVYAGDSQAPIDWEVSGTQTPNTARTTPAELFAFPRDLPPPSITGFEALAPPLGEGMREPVLETQPVASETEPEKVSIFDGRPISALAPEEVEALIAYELARDRFRAELETPAAPRVRASEPPAPAPAPTLAEPLPVAAEVVSEPEGPRKRSVWPLVGGGLLLGVVLATAMSLNSSGAPTPAVASAESSPPGSEVSESAQPSGPLASEVNRVGSTTASAPSAAPAASAASSAELDPKRRSTKVALEVFPLDAKVMLRGARKRGPPYEFEVLRGRRIVIEVSRKGYVARKVVLDGSETSLTIGLSKDAASSASASGASEPRIGVRSGL